MPIFGLGKKKEVATEEKPATIDDAMLHNTKGVSAEEAFKRSPPLPQETPTPVQKEPMNDDDDLFADFPMFGETESNEQKKAQPQAQPPPTTPQEEPQQPVAQEEAPAPSLDDAPPQPQPQTRFKPAHTEQFAESLNEEVPDLMDVPQNTSVNVKIRGDVNTNEIPEADAPEQNYDVQNVEFASPASEEVPVPVEEQKETLLNYIVKKGKGRMELFIELHDMRKLTDDIDNLSAIEKKSDHGFSQVNEIHEHEKKLLANLRKSLEDMHRQFNLMDALIFENNEDNR